MGTQCKQAAVGSDVHPKSYRIAPLVETVMPHSCISLAEPAAGSYSYLSPSLPYSLVLYFHFIWLTL